ncbi:DUF3307 domain-containing protein [Paenibacillus sp. J2TS4]|uniref:DUF3307 domain-containing protein n=1 Tax=Paenibacillus sp. J2TS4 TaxID=2807194 RepID=UPI001B191FFA|nr:DUF3307 domain-containing protein [Paenibacillus sp. J2TS4]GIP33350.1 hypothetical protein J2TS4_25600 [Paenibacillus sp. J2TS4]
MNQFSAFDLLLIAHLIGDYLLQTEWMAKYKAERWGALLTHSLVYTAVIALFAFLWIPGGVSIWGILLVFGSHVFLDRRKPVAYWYEKIMRVTDERSKWLMIIVDQTFHLIVLALILLLPAV